MLKVYVPASLARVGANMTLPPDTETKEGASDDKVNVSVEDTKRDSVVPILTVSSEADRVYICTYLSTTTVTCVSEYLPSCPAIGT